MPALRLRDADVAADALTDLAVETLLDLGGEKGVGDRRAGRSDQVPGARVDDLRHAIRVRQARDTHDGLGRGLADAAGPFQLVPLREESGGAGVLRPFGDRADVHVPEIHQVVGEADELEAFVELDAGRAECVDARPHRDDAVVSDGFADDLERLEPEPRSVLQGAAVLVGALVVEGGEELQRQVAVAAVDVDDVESRRARLLGGKGPVGLDPPDVRLLHRLGHVDRVVVARELRGPDARPARLTGVSMAAAMRQLDAGERAVLVGLIAHEGQIPGVVLVPEPRGDVRRLVRVCAHGRVLRAHGRPATLGLHAAEPRLGARLLRAEAGAVRNAVEAVLECLRPDLHGLEENVVLGVARHVRSLSRGVRVSGQ